MNQDHISDQVVPPGHIASVVTHLEMLSPVKIEGADCHLLLKRWLSPPIDDYLSLFRLVGTPWLWTSRLLMSAEAVAAIIHDPAVEISLIQDEGRNIGFIELDFRTAHQCEISFFGMIPEYNGKGYGRWLMQQALDQAWRADIQRLWLHTCSLDSPRALPFYQQCGFKIFDQQPETMPDPRLSGHLPLTAAPHIPLVS